MIGKYLNAHGEYDKPRAVYIVQIHLRIRRKCFNVFGECDAIIQAHKKNIPKEYYCILLKYCKILHNFRALFLGDN
jgi:hypothetical protein